MKEQMEIAEVAEQVLEIVRDLDADIAVAALATATGSMVALRFDTPNDVLGDVIDTIRDTVTDLAATER